MTRSKWAIAACLGFGTTLGVSVASAQTWTGNRTTPRVAETVAVDATGESGWPYGQEDVAGDGLQNFEPAEQAADLRTAYAATDAQAFFFRTYVSATTNPTADVSVFLFIDADRNANTGGSAQAPEVEPRFTSDPSDGGYEHVVVIGGDGTVQLWSWQIAPALFQQAQTTPAEASAETGTDLDPIRINGPSHGYLQATVALDRLGLTEVCNADLLVRSVSDAPEIEAGDLQLGARVACRPPDANNDDVPDIIVPPGGCTSDAACPADGICAGGRCVIPVECETGAQCGADEECSNGRCVVVPGGACETAADCGDRVCSGDMCAPCANDAACGDGRRCAADGRCVGSAPGTGGTGPVLRSDEQVQGGAFSCGMRPGSRGLALVGLGALWTFILVGRRGRRQRLIG